MFCSSCGSKVVEGKPFCTTCGQAQPPASASASDSTSIPVLEAGAQLGTAPLPGAGAAPNRAGSGGGEPVYRSSAAGTVRGRPMPSTQIEAKGFFASLFDFGFTSFITLKFLRVIYGVVVVLILVTGVVLFVASISQGGIYAVFAIVVVPIVTLIYLVLTRVSLEIVALFFRIGENTSLMVAAANRPRPTGEAVRAGLGSA
jgi:hypothetical protein